MSDTHENRGGLMDMLGRPLNRRSFLVKTGTAAALGAVMVSGLSGCENDSVTNPGNAIDVGSGDTGILNYAFALEQLEAAFYTQVVDASNFTSLFSSEEQAILKDLRDHEVAHREFFRQVLAGNAIQDLTPDFSSIDFNNKSSILNNTRDFEDLGVSAYNGAGKYLADANNLLIAGKIVSVEARHASIIRYIINPNSSSFAGDDAIVDPTTGLERSRSPQAVVSIANNFLSTKISANNFS